MKSIYGGFLRGDVRREYLICIYVGQECGNCSRFSNLICFDCSLLPVCANIGTLPWSRTNFPIGSDGCSWNNNGRFNSLLKWTFNYFWRDELLKTYIFQILDHIDIFLNIKLYCNIHYYLPKILAFPVFCLIENFEERLCFKFYINEEMIYAIYVVLSYFKFHNNQYHQTIPKLT